jgi:hypothetical protein
MWLFRRPTAQVGYFLSFATIHPCMARASAADLMSTMTMASLVDEFTSFGLFACVVKWLTKFSIFVKRLKRAQQPFYVPHYK